MNSSTSPVTATAGSPGDPYAIDEVLASDSAGLAEVARLHMELLSFGPMAALGTRFIREICYRALMDAGVLRVFLLTVEGEAAGFVAYTANSYDFHKQGLKRHWFRAGTELLRAGLSQPGGPGKVMRAVRWVLGRRGETPTGGDANGEVVCVAVLPKYLKPAYRFAGGMRASELLIDFAGRRLFAEGARAMRMIVQAENRAVLLLYHLMGARFESYEMAGEPQVQVWFELDADGLKNPKRTSG